MKRGFSLLTALVFLILIATISALSISLSTQSVKQTTDIYLKNEAELLLRSGTEFAMLAMSGYPDYNTSCLETINMTYNSTYDINVTIKYIGTNMHCSVANTLDNNISTADSNRTVIIDTVVTTNPALTTDGTIPEQIHLHRRTIQKP